MAINVLEVIRQGQVGGGESHLLDLIAGFDNRVNPIVLSFTGGRKDAQGGRSYERRKVRDAEKCFG